MNILQELKNTGTTAKYKQKVVNFDQLNNLVELDKFKKMETKYKFSQLRIAPSTPLKRLVSSTQVLYPPIHNNAKASFGSP